MIRKVHLALEPDIPVCGVRNTCLLTSNLNLVTCENCLRVAKARYGKDDEEEEVRNA